MHQPAALLTTRMARLVMLQWQMATMHMTVMTVMTTDTTVMEMEGSTISSTAAAMGSTTALLMVVTAEATAVAPDIMVVRLWCDANCCCLGAGQLPTVHGPLLCSDSVLHAHSFSADNMLLPSVLRAWVMAASHIQACWTS